MVDVSRETDSPNIRGTAPFGAGRLCFRNLCSRRL
jgi:hypothetical protein